jgi:5'-nucleotidase
VIRVTGAALLAALENSVSAYPALEGRFPQVSDIKMEFDPSLPPHHRISWVEVGGKALDLERKYVLVTRGYMGRGKDGYDSLLVKSEGGEAEEVVSEENGMLISMMLRQYFMSLKIIGKWKHWGKSLSRHWNAIHEDLHQTHPVVEPNLDGEELARKNTRTGTTTPLDDSEDESGHRVPAHSDQLKDRELLIARKVSRKWRRLAGIRPEANCVDPMHEGEFQVHWTRVSALAVKSTKTWPLTSISRQSHPVSKAEF